MSNIDLPFSFSRLVKQYFDFLIDDFGFKNHANEIGFVKEDLEILFYQGNGELDIIFYMRRDDKNFRPYVSRSFYLIEVINKLNKSRVKPPKGISGYIISKSDVELYLSFSVELMKSHSTALFNSDDKVFIDIHQQRREDIISSKGIH